MKTVSVYEAEGMVLCHDLTQIIPGQFKGVAFRKGHIIRKADIPQLLDMGKENLYVWDIGDNLLHENEAALRMARAAAGNGVELSEPKEGKIQLLAKYSGLLKINVESLFAINEVAQVMFATLHTNQRVEPGKPVAGTRVIPLVIDRARVEQVEAICRSDWPLVEIKPFRPLKVGLVTTGSEVFSGRIKDKFGPVIVRKVEQLGSRVLRQIFVPDSAEMIARAIRTLLKEGVDLITTTGGMSVDPDDVTPSGIIQAGGDVVSYGVPVLPGAMFMLAYMGDVPVLGLPGCVMYHKNTIFDLILQRIAAGEKVNRRDIIRLAHGGMCLNCKECRFPDCAFGK